MVLVYFEKGKGLTTYCSPELKSFLSFPIQWKDKCNIIEFILPL
jgi:hypothetical protein